MGPRVVLMGPAGNFDPVGSCPKWVRGPGLTQPARCPPAEGVGLWPGWAVGERVSLPVCARGGPQDRHRCCYGGKPSPEQGPSVLGASVWAEHADTLVGTYVPNSCLCSELSALWRKVVRAALQAAALSPGPILCQLRCGLSEEALGSGHAWP